MTVASVSKTFACLAAALAVGAVLLAPSDANAGKGGKGPNVRDHRSKPVVRDHRTKPVVRDHRKPLVGLKGPF